ncbi:hypothetical protein AAF712_012438 [Marasmius tenuissimus]|uniref:Uncharacterized protein n=1 Tax=Marasmius tenuissimus TaxID=585030 RepID=A0ABR2ZGL6_9AGAR
MFIHQDSVEYMYNSPVGRIDYFEARINDHSYISLASGHFTLTLEGSDPGIRNHRMKVKAVPPPLVHRSSLAAGQDNSSEWGFLLYLPAQPTECKLPTINPPPSRPYTSTSAAKLLGVTSVQVVAVIGERRLVVPYEAPKASTLAYEHHNMDGSRTRSVILDSIPSTLGFARDAGGGCAHGFCEPELSGSLSLGYVRISASTSLTKHGIEKGR